MNSTTPWLRVWSPVMMEARLDMQMAVVTAWLAKTVPRAARASMLGVLMRRLPMQPRVSQRWSSERRKRMLGG